MAKPRATPYKVADALGLYLFVAPSGLKGWRANYVSSGKQRTRTYGRWPEVTLAQARKLHNLAKDQTVLTVTNTVASVVSDWLAKALPSLSNTKHQIQVQHTLEATLVAQCGTKLISQIKRAELVAVCQAVQARGTIETAHRVAGRIGQVFDYAVDAGLIESSPAIGLSRVLQPRRVQRAMASIDPKDAGELMRAIARYSDFAGDCVTRTALQVLAHTFVRTVELRGMRWDEMPERGVWVVPAERMKLRKPHVVPLSDVVLQLIEPLRANGTELVFESPTRPGSGLSENTMLFALYRLGYRGRMTGHGFRALASTVLNEQSGFAPDVIERQLAHSETNAVRAAYNRAQYLDERKKLMAWWSAWLTQEAHRGQPDPKAPFACQAETGGSCPP